MVKNDGCEELKEMVLEFFDDDEAYKKIAKKVENFECKKNGKKKSREPSKYNMFIKQCMSSPENGGQGKNMKECAQLYKEQKT